eukprot:gene5894-4211_t
MKKVCHFLFLSCTSNKITTKIIVHGTSAQQVTTLSAPLVVLVESLSLSLILLFPPLSAHGINKKKNSCAMIFFCCIVVALTYGFPSPQRRSTSLAVNRIPSRMVDTCK